MVRERGAAPATAQQILSLLLPPSKGELLLFSHKNFALSLSLSCTKALRQWTLRRAYPQPPFGNDPILGCSSNSLPVGVGGGRISLSNSIAVTDFDEECEGFRRSGELRTDILQGHRRKGGGASGAQVSQHLGAMGTRMWAVVGQ